ncbi:hypothetical protein I6H52_08310 [Corynebacterium urealyticum]|uniref:Uncharacterized protein n=2 Tax=Corynebacterium urealyticum TaxID=43771 RepID=A0A5D4FZ90_9CORY|nr:hypothetical protein [Corynebacterium urealyticum]AGE36268.1 putative membrane protein [Corynebacterium urealyticum DSM 7111]QQB07938.1 hypothetical protein I6H53_02010 [Corynebacterium urealyticum]QQC41874.1 hypothetical protein I6H51_09375 [Corynebacterium urealyticum]QQE50497.1 hypothetical protein I6H52_08310 [Corynebacterium urealyticum]TYR15767.1 hypothetical protein FYJ89_04405 [Corynebacterium urealyticum]
MDQFITALHVIAAILLIGPVAVATSAFAPTLRAAQSGSAKAVGSVATLAGMTRRYGYISLLVPVLGLVAFMTVDGAMQNYAFHAAILTSLVAWLVLLLAVIPQQRRGLISVDGLDESDTPASEDELAAVQGDAAQALPGKAAMFGGIFNLLWLVTAILMFV